MKNIVKSFKSYISDTNNKAKVYFGFYFIFFILVIIFLVANNNANANIKTKCPDQRPALATSTTANYGFRYEISMNDTTTILEGSRFNNETTIDKRIDDVITKYYIYYSDTYIQNTEKKWTKYNGNIIDNFDENLIDINYINDTLQAATQKSKTDSKIVYESKDKKLSIVVYYKDTTVNSINITEGDVSVKLSFYDIGKITDPNITIDNDTQTVQDKNN